VLSALKEARAAGLSLLLVTGRIVEELRADFPDVDEHFDAIVAENGAVFSSQGSTRMLAAPVSLERKGQRKLEFGGTCK
jgi:hydroxymethylpyrimidine pyrophosphatase-like HAD family hydrolase